MENPVRLSEGFTLRDVLDGGASFEVMASNMTEAELEPATRAFEGSNHLSHVRTDIIDTEGDQFSTPFERHRQLMKNVTPDGAVKKTIVRRGVGDRVPPHAFVTFHYNAYAEYQDEPHDSSVLRGKPWRVKLGSGALLPGLEIGILSMCKNERADILIQPHLAFGRIGSPPRIPPNAEILYDVELLEVTSEPSAELIEEIDGIQLEGTPWERTEKQVKRLILEGNDHHKNKYDQKAVRAYRSATKLAVNCSLKDEKEEDQQTRLLVRLYLNLAVVNMELRNYNDVCINCREALALKTVDPTTDSGRTSYVKAHLFWGKALTALNELDSAERHLKKAKNEINNEPSVNKALEALNKKKEEVKKSDSLFCRNALQLKEEPAKKQEPVGKPSVSSAWQKQLCAFKDNPDEKRMKLPAGLDSDELAAVRAEAKSLNLKVDQASGFLVISKMP